VWEGGGTTRCAMTEERLIELLRKIQALHERAGTDGERRAAAAARDRITARLRHATQDREIEYRFIVYDPWARRLLFALLRRDGLEPFRYPRQRRHSVMVRGRRHALEEKWEEFRELNARLAHYLDEVTERIISAALHADCSEPEVQDVLAS